MGCVLISQINHNYLVINPHWGSNEFGGKGLIQNGETGSLTSGVRGSNYMNIPQELLRLAGEKEREARTLKDRAAQNSKRFSGN